VNAALGNALGLLVSVAVGGAAGHWAARSAPRVVRHATAARVATPRSAAATLAFLSPLKRGDNLDGWTVRRIGGVEHGAVHVLFARGDDLIELSVALSSDAGPVPPARAGRYAIFYSIRHSTTLEGDTGTSLAGALAQILSKNESVAPPPGLTPFQLDTHVQ
jgi:hypothetical protein